VEQVPRWSKRYTFQAFEMMLGDGCWGEMKYKQRLANILLTVPGFGDMGSPHYMVCMAGGLVWRRIIIEFLCKERECISGVEVPGMDAESVQNNC
jgi:hypothetical protein